MAQAANLRRRMGLSVTRLAGALGAEVRGLDLSRALERGEINALRQALIEHLVVTVPDQAMSLDDLERLTDQLGGRAVTPFVKPLPDRPFVIRVLKEREDKLNFANA